MPDRRHRRGTWLPVWFATWNFGPGTLADLLGLMATFTILAIQEAGDRGKVIAGALHDAGWKDITGPEPGQSSTPLLYDPAAHQLLRVFRILIAHAQDVGPGAGPSRMKQKWLIGGLFRDLATGRLFLAFSVHYVATQGKPKRHQVALATSRRIAVAVARFTLAVFILGDFNTTPTSPVARILRRAGLAFTQLADKMLGTHGRRAIDQITWTPRPWIDFVKQWVIVTHSDHKALGGEFLFKVRRRWVRRHAAAA
jgi:hypothetical protein